MGGKGEADWEADNVSPLERGQKLLVPALAALWGKGASTGWSHPGNCYRKPRSCQAHQKRAQSLSVIKYNQAPGCMSSSLVMIKTHIFKGKPREGLCERGSTWEQGINNRGEIPLNPTGLTPSRWSLPGTEKGRPHSTSEVWGPKKKVQVWGWEMTLDINDSKTIKDIYNYWLLPWEAKWHKIVISS